MRGKHDEAFEAASNSLRLFEVIEDQQGLANVYAMMGLIKDDVYDYASAIRYHELSIEMHEKAGNKRGVAKGLNNIAGVYFSFDSLELCLSLFERSLAIRRELGEEQEIKESLSNLGYVHRQMGNYDLAFEYSKQVIPIAERLNDRAGIVTGNINLAELYWAVGKIDSAALTVQKVAGLARELGINKRVMAILHLQYKIKRKKGQFEEALEHYISYRNLRDSVINADINAKINKLEKSYETEKQEKEIAELQQEKRNQLALRNLFAFSALAALLFAYLVFRFFRFRQLKNQELLQAKEDQARQLEEINHLKSRFFANISHEFRTPLTLILGPLDQLKHQLPLEEQRGLVDMMKRNGQRLLKLINQLLDLSKVEAGKLGLKTSLKDIVPLLKGWTMAFRSLADQQDIALNLQIDKAQYLLYFEQDKIEQVMSNLLSNALKYTPEGGRIDVLAKEVEHEGRKHLGIIIQDSGKGIATAELPHVFDYFFQASNADGDETLGTGIGLALVKEFVELHGGKVEVISSLGVGSSFMIYLPFGKEHLKSHEINLLVGHREEATVVKEEAWVGFREETMVPPMLDAGERPKVLLVEDNNDLRHYISDILKDDFQVFLAADGEEGVKKAVELIPDLVISDVMMPRKDGLEVCKELKSDIRTSHIPVILLTAKNTSEDRLKGFEHMADEYLAKPFNNQELQLRIQNLIQIRQQIQAHFATKEILKPAAIKVNSMDQRFLESLRTSLETHIDDLGFGVEQLAEEVALSRSQLHRKLKSITNLSPNQYIRNFRLQRAMELLEQQSASVTEIAMQVGFSNPSYFAKVFNEQFGKAPSEVLKR